MPNLKRFTASQIESLAGVIRQRLADRLITGDGLRALLEDLKFRDQVGDTWTIGPITGRWYRYEGGGWSPAPARADASLDGRVDFDIFGDPRDIKLPEPPAQAEDPGSITDIGAYITAAVDSVARAYASGQVHSDAAEAVLEGIYAVDGTGTVWSLGVRSRLWYTFTETGWQPSQLPLNNESFRGTAGAHNAEEKVSRFLTFTGDQFPEPIVPPWDPPTSYPELTQTCPHCSALNVGDVKVCVSCKRPLAQAGRPAPAARAPSQSPAPIAASSPPPAVPDAPAPGPKERAARLPAAPSTAPGRGPRRRWLLWGIGACLLVACLCAAGLLAFGLLNGMPGLSLFPGSSPDVEQPADLPPFERPDAVIPTSPFALEDRFDDPARTAVPLFGPAAMEFEVDPGIGGALMTAHNPGVLVAVYDSPVIADFEATLEFAPLDPVPGAGYGMVFRSDDAADGLAHYFLLLASPSDGNVSLSRWGPGGLTELGRVPFTPAADGFINLFVRAQAGFIEVEVDGQPGIKVLDAAAEPGIFGLAMLSSRDGDQVLFTNFVVEAASP